MIIMKIWAFTHALKEKYRRQTVELKTVKMQKEKDAAAVAFIADGMDKRVEKMKQVNQFYVDFQ